MERLIPNTRTNHLLRLSRDGWNVIRVPDVREDSANWREAGYSVELMVKAVEMVIDWRGSALARTARRQGAV
jgi:hypothetical protein